MALDVRRVRRDFPILRRKLSGPDGRQWPLAYLDHAATTHPPQQVLDAVSGFCGTSYGYVNRGNNTLSQEASAAFEDAMAAMARFVGADPQAQPAILGCSTTHVLDIAAHLVAHRPGRTLATWAEHHSNDLPHRARGETVHAGVDAEGRVLLDDVERHLSRGGVKLLAVTGASNVTGVMPPVHKLARMAHDHGALFLLDAAQMLAHAPIDVKRPDHPEHIDLVAAAGHKSYAPFGSAFLVAPRALVDEAPPYMAGSGTVRYVTETSAPPSPGPARHMAGSQNVVGAVAFAEALRYLSGLGMENVRAHEESLVRAALRRFQELREDHGVRLLGPADPAGSSDRAGVFAFLVPGRGHADVAGRLDRDHAIVTRNGLFCAHPLMARLLGLGAEPEWTRSPAGLAAAPGAVRASFGVYNTEDEVHRLADALAHLASEAKARPAAAVQPVTVPLRRAARAAKAGAAKPGSRRSGASAPAGRPGGANRAGGHRKAPR